MKKLALFYLLMPLVSSGQDQLKSHINQDDQSLWPNNLPPKFLRHVPEWAGQTKILCLKDSFGSDFKVTYNPQGFIESQSGGLLYHTDSFFYDSRNRLIRMTRSNGFRRRGDYSFSYNDKGRLARTLWQSGNSGAKYGGLAGMTVFRELNDSTHEIKSYLMDSSSPKWRPTVKQLLFFSNDLLDSTHFYHFVSVHSHADSALTERDFYFQQTTPDGLLEWKLKKCRPYATNDSAIFGYGPWFDWAWDSLQTNYITREQRFTSGYLNGPMVISIVQKWDARGNPISYVFDVPGPPGLFLYDSSINYQYQDGLLHSMEYQDPFTYRLYEDCSEPDFHSTLERGDAALVEPNLYPNPSNGQFKLEVKQPFHLEVFALSGELLLVKDYSAEGLYFISVPEAKPGIYLLRLRLNDGSLVQKKLVFE